MKKKLWIGLLIITLVILGWILWNSQSGSSRVVWDTEPLSTGTIRQLVAASGTLSATNTVEVGTQVSGVIEEINVDFNDEVTKGEVIARLDIRNLKAALDQASAELTQAEIQVAQKKRALEFAKKYNPGDVADLSVLEAEASLSQIKAQLDQAERNYKRYEELLEKGVVARIEYETKLTEYEQLKASYESMLANLNRTKANVGTVDLQKSQEDLRLAEANLASARANSDRAKINLQYASIVAPINGIVLSRNIEVGQTVASSFQTPVLFIIADDLTKMEIEASIDEADIGLIRKSQKVNFTVDAFLNETFTGEVEEIRLQPEIVSNVVTYTVIISAPNDQLKLMPGMTASMEIVTDERTDALRTPIAAINFDPPDDYRQPYETELQKMRQIGAGQNSWNSGILWILDGNQPVPKAVRTGLSDDQYIEITEGDVQTGEVVVKGTLTTEKSPQNQQSSPFMPRRPGAQRSN
jgi:HlyD family secretion protein